MEQKISENKKRVVAWLYPEMIRKMENVIEINDMKNHTEFVAKATEFYIGYLSTQNATGYLSKVLVSAVQGILKETETRTANNLFRLSVELDMMMNILAVGLEVEDAELASLRKRCVQEVKKMKGRITLEDAVDFQRD